MCDEIYTFKPKVMCLNLYRRRKVGEEALSKFFAGELRPPSHQLHNPFILIKKSNDEFKIENYLEMLILENWKEIAKNRCKNRHTNIPTYR